MSRGKMPPGARGKIARRNERLLQRIQERAETRDDRIARVVDAVQPAPAPAPEPTPVEVYTAWFDKVDAEMAAQRAGEKQRASAVLDQVDALGDSSGLYDINKANPITRNELAESFQQWVNDNATRQVRFLDGDVSLATDYFRALKASYDRQVSAYAIEVVGRRGGKSIPAFKAAMEDFTFEPASVLEKRQAAAQLPAAAPAGKRRYDLD